MTAPELNRRDASDRRSWGERRSADHPVPVDRRKSERRAGIERRLALQSAAGQVYTALDMLVLVAESDALSDEHRRLLDAAMLRLRFAAERMERE